MSGSGKDVIVTFEEVKSEEFDVDVKGRGCNLRLRDAADPLGEALSYAIKHTQIISKL
jgi:hypothetical protein